MKRRLVLDTNIVISALIFGGAPRIIYESIVFGDNIEAFSSENALSELLRVLKDKFKYSKKQLLLVESKYTREFSNHNAKKYC